MAPEPCPPWVQDLDEKLPSIASGLEAFYQFVQRKAKAHLLNANDIKMWHGKIFAAAVPLKYYAGNFRGADPKKYPCLAGDAHLMAPTGAVLSSGTPFAQVETQMRQFSSELVANTEQTDRFISGTNSLAERLKVAVQLAAFCHGTLVRIHPFVNGNGRMSRITTDYFLYRYGFPFAFWPPTVRPGLGYEQAAHECMQGNNRPLYEYLLTVMVGRVSDLAASAK